MSWLDRDRKNDDLNKRVADLTRENIRLSTLNEDMNGQIRDGLKRKSFGEKEYEDIVRRLREHGELVQAQAEIIEYLRDRYPSDFRGLIGDTTSAMPSFAQTVLRYLERG